MSHAGQGAGNPARYRIEHTSRFTYSTPVRRSTMSLCLQPLESSSQRLLDFTIATTPPARFTTEPDPFGNVRHVVTLHRDHDSLEVVPTSTVEVAPPPVLPDNLGSSACDEVRSSGDHPDWWDFTRPSPVARPSPALDRFVARLGIRPGNDPLADLLGLSATLHEAFEYAPGATSVDSPIDEILTTGKGVCQDYTHMLVAIARSWGIPTRYVSGYLYVGEGEAGEAGAAFRAATHAWAETRLPIVGWVGIDPTNRAVADEKYVRIAIGREYRDVPPTRGVIEGGGDGRLEVEVRMRLSGDAADSRSLE